MKITEDKVDELIRTINKGLVCGLGHPRAGEMCVMHAISLIIHGIEYSDAPMCVDEDIAQFDVYLNDQSWSSDKARAKGMVREAVAKLGSNYINGYQWTIDVFTKAYNILVPLLLQKQLKSKIAPTFKYFSFNDEKMFLEQLQDYFTKHYVDAKHSVFLTEASEICEDMSLYSAVSDALIQMADCYDDTEDAIRVFIKNYPSKKKDEALKILSDIATEMCIKHKTEGSKFLYLLD